MTNVNERGDRRRAPNLEHRHDTYRFFFLDLFTNGSSTLELEQLHTLSKIRNWPFEFLVLHFRNSPHHLKTDRFWTAFSKLFTLGWAHTAAPELWEALAR